MARVKARLVVLAIVLVCVLAIVGQIAKAAAPPSHRDRDPVYSPNGKALAFVRTTDRTSRVYVVSATGTGLHPVTPAQPLQSGLAWSPDGLSLAYVSDTHLWRVDLRSGVPQQLTDVVEDDIEPEWSPDGSQIAFTRFEDCWRCTTIYELPVTGGVPRILVANGYARHAVWSPDGSQFVDSSGAVRSAVDGSIVGHVGPGSAFDWSNRGIAWVSGGAVYVGSPDGSSIRRVAGARGAVATFSRWSRNGQRIAFGLDGWLAVAATNTSSWHRIVRASVANDAPSWAPNGTIAYVERNGCGIDTILPDRTHHRRLTHAC